MSVLIRAKSYQLVQSEFVLNNMVIMTFLFEDTSMGGCLPGAHLARYYCINRLGVNP